MTRKNITLSLLLLCFIMPLFSYAQSIPLSGTAPSLGSLESDNKYSNTSRSSTSCAVPKTLQELFAYGICLLNSGIIPFLIGLGLVIFLIGVVGYVKAGDNEEKRQAGRDLMIFGIVALFVMVAVWGLVKILYTTFIGGDFSVNSNAPTGLK